MASYTVTAGNKGTSGTPTLVASTVDTVTFEEDAPSLEVASPPANSDDIWFTNDGTTPTVGGANTYYLPPGHVDVREPARQEDGSVVVKLISSGTPKYRVQRGV